MRAAVLILVGATSWASDAFGVWKLNSALSTRAGNEKSMTLRIEPHNRGEVLTLEILGADGRASTSSNILYFDGHVSKSVDKVDAYTSLRMRFPK